MKFSLILSDNVNPIFIAPEPRPDITARITPDRELTEPPSRFTPAIVIMITPISVRISPVKKKADFIPEGKVWLITIGIMEPTMVDIPIDMPYTIDIPILVIPFEKHTADKPHSAPQKAGKRKKFIPFSPIMLHRRGATYHVKQTDVIIHIILYIPQNAAHEKGEYFL